MKRMITVCLIVLLVAGGPLRAKKVYQYRWFYMSRNLSSDLDVAYISDKIRAAADAGLNGMVLSAGLDRLSMQTDAYLRRLDQVKAVCDSRGVELIPIIFSVGYGGSVLAHNKELAAGIPVVDALYVAGDGKAGFVPDPQVSFVNGGFEKHDANRVSGYRFNDRPGEVSFVDTAVFAEGAAALRFEGFGAFEHGHARVMQEVAVRPHRLYRVSCRVKTETLQPEGCFRLMVLADGRTIAPFGPRVPGTTDWRKVTLGFNSLGYDKVRIYVGAWSGKGGRFWVDDLRIEEIGMVNLLRRPVTPITIVNERTGSASAFITA